MTEFIALGENCLPDEILTFLQKKGESYPFGSGRFNIEYITEIIRTDFIDLMAADKLVKGITEDKEVVWNTHYRHRNDIYADTVSRHFEFTHHNIFEEAPRRSFNRKIQRLKQVLEEKRDVVFVYHYLHSSKHDPEKMIDLLDSFLNVLKKKYGRRYKCILWYQNPSSAERKILVRKNRNILIGEFFTQDHWHGETLWNAPNDRELFIAFFQHDQLKKYIQGIQFFLKFGEDRNQRAV